MTEFSPDDYVYPECGCHITVTRKIAYCPRHEAAPELHEAVHKMLEDSRYAVSDVNDISTAKIFFQSFIEMFTPVLASVDGAGE